MTPNKKYNALCSVAVVQSRLVEIQFSRKTKESNTIHLETSPATSGREMIRRLEGGNGRVFEEEDEDEEVVMAVGNDGEGNIDDRLCLDEAMVVRDVVVRGDDEGGGTNEKSAFVNLTPPLLEPEEEGEEGGGGGSKLTMNSPSPQ